MPSFGTNYGMKERKNVNRFIAKYFNKEQEDMTSFVVKAWNNYLSFEIKPFLEKSSTGLDLYDNKNSISFLISQIQLTGFNKGLKLLRKGKLNSFATEDRDGKLFRVFKQDNDYFVAITNADKNLKTIREEIVFRFMSKSVLDMENVIYVNLFEEGKEYKRVATNADFESFCNLVNTLTENGISYHMQNVAYSVQYQFDMLSEKLELIKKLLENTMLNSGSTGNNRSESRFSSSRFGKNSKPMIDNSRSSGNFSDEEEEARKYKGITKEISEENISDLFDEDEDDEE